MIKQDEIKGHYGVATQVNKLLLDMIKINGTKGTEVDYILFYFTQYFPISESHLKRRITLMEKLGIVVVSSENIVYSDKAWSELESTKKRLQDGYGGWNEKPFPYIPPKEAQA